MAASLAPAAAAGYGSGMADPLSLAQQAVAAHRGGDHARAETLYRAFLAREPDHPVALHLLGMLLHERGRTRAGLPLLERAAALQPGDPEVLSNLAVALQQVGRVAEAAQAAARAVGLDPRNPAAHGNLGAALLALRRLPEARESFARALALRPDPGTIGNLGLAHLELGEAQEAAACFRAAVRDAPEAAQGHVHLGNALLALGELPEALASFEAACDRDPGHGRALSMRAHLRQVLCDWSGLAADREALAARPEPWRAEDPPAPFALLALIDDPRLQLRRARAHAATFAPPTTAARPKPPAPGGRARLAYLSPDFRQHPVAALMADVIAAHDRSRFEVFALSYGPDDGGALRDRIREGADHFADLRERGDAEAAALIREAGIDVAVDLAGFTTHARPGILASRPARLQVSYLGYPGSTGAPWIDYTLGDAFVADGGALQEAFSEALVQLPGCFQANGLRPRPGPDDGREEVRRADHGLPETGLVLACFGSPYKLTPEVFAVWMRVLQAVPDSVLWLVAEHPAARRNLAAEAGRHGVAAERLVFAPRVAYETYLARMRCADLVLDTVPYNGGTTASDVLWMGVPLLTCAGRSYASRMAGSLLHALGLPDLVAPDLAAYEREALRLAADPAALAVLRGRLAARLAAGPALFDPVRFTRGLEVAYGRMLARAARGLRPAGFAVEAES
ncbi:O-linked N-acetylglucosamine transferase, SPINDLY family protein [Methylobacterium sp. JK268]